MAGTDEAASGASSTPSAPKPLLRIVSPDATAEEIAAIVAVFAALGSGGPAPRRRTSEWSRPARGHRAAVTSGPGGWRASALPR